MKTIYIWTGVLLLAAILTLPKAFGLDAEPMDDAKDAQRASQRQAAEDQCTAIYGNHAMFFETRKGNLICRNGSFK